MTRPARPVALLLAALLLAACGGGGNGGGGTGGAGPDERITLDPANAEADRAAQALLQKALRAANVHYYDGENTYEGFDAAAAAAIDDSVTWLDGTDPEVEQVSITAATKTNVHFVTRSSSGVYFCLRNLNQFGRGEYLDGYGASFADVDGSGECIGEG